MPKRIRKVAMDRMQCDNITQLVAFGPESYKLAKSGDLYACGPY
jgi:hypothetical protein